MIHAVSKGEAITKKHVDLGEWPINYSEAICDHR